MFLLNLIVHRFSIASPKKNDGFMVYSMIGILCLVIKPHQAQAAKAPVTEDLDLLSYCLESLFHTLSSAFANFSIAVQCPFHLSVK